MTLEDMIQRVHGAGLKVNNLFEAAKGGWQANLRGPDGICRHYGHGETPMEALRMALGAPVVRPAIPLREASAEDLL